MAHSGGAGQDQAEVERIFLRNSVPTELDLGQSSSSGSPPMAAR